VSDQFIQFGMIAVLALMVVFMFRNSRKQKADREALQSKIVTGAPIMTTSGIFGTVLSVDDDQNEVVIESLPGTKFRLHRQAIASVVEPKADVAAKTSTKRASQTTAKKTP